MKIQPGRVAVITGAASGIGLALAGALARRGVGLVLADIDKSGLQMALQAFGEKVDARAIHCDVSSPEQVAALCDEAFDRYGQVDYVFSNAGVVLPFAPMWEHSPAEWEWLLNINLGGVINGIRSFIPRFIAQGRGHLINTASMAGVTRIPFNGVYNASKHAVVSLTETLAAELADRAPAVRASVVCLGTVPTAIQASPRSGATPISRDAIAPGAVKSAITAAEAADRILHGIEQDEIYIFPNPNSAGRIAARNEAIMAAAKRQEECH